MSRFLLLGLALVSLLFNGCRKEETEEAPAAQKEEETADQQVKELQEGYAFSVQERFQANIEWIHQPKSGADAAGSNMAMVGLLKPSGATPDKFELTGFHPRKSATGQGSIESSQTFVDVEDVAGKVLVKGIVFTAPGDAGFWQILLEANVDGQKDEVIISIDQEIVPIKPIGLR